MKKKPTPKKPEPIEPGRKPIEVNGRKPLKPIDISTYQGRFGNQIRKHRKRTKLTGEAITAKLNELGCPISIAAYFRWESGQSSPPINHLPILATALKLRSVKQLFPDN